MTKTVERALFRRIIFGKHKPSKTSRIINSFGNGSAERKPDYRTVRRQMRTWTKEYGHDADHEILYWWTSHREVKRRMHEMCKQMNIPWRRGK